MKTPVAIIIFKRARQTKAVIDALRLIKPEKIYIIADGPRTKEEKELCENTRAVIDTIDWKCDIKKKYSEMNLGLGVNISQGLNWVFNSEERAIILEDDCVPHPSFFPFCAELLEKYNNEEKVMHISGNFFQQSNRGFKNNNSYYASILPHVWGWATWKRAWKKYDYKMTLWPEAREKGILVRWFKNPAGYEYWSSVWDQYLKDSVNNWDARWAFACMINSGICLNPTSNLVTNIGFDELATHTKVPNKTANIPAEEMIFPLVHPAKIEIDYKADAFTLRKNFGVDEKLKHRIIRPIKNVFPKTYWKIRNLFKH